MKYEVHLGFPIDPKKRVKFKHAAELGGSNMKEVLTSFIDMYIENKLKPEDVKKLAVS